MAQGIDLKYAINDLNPDPETETHFFFKVSGSEGTGTYNFETRFYGQPDLTTEFP